MKKIPENSGKRDIRIQSVQNVNEDVEKTKRGTKKNYTSVGHEEKAEINGNLAEKYGKVNERNKKKMRKNEKKKRY